MTVLFADLVDSTALGDGRDPEELRAAVRPQLARMRAALERPRRHVREVRGRRGDGGLRRAGRSRGRSRAGSPAALAIRDAIPGVRIGVNTGEAVVELGASSGAGEGNRDRRRRHDDVPDRGGSRRRLRARRRVDVSGPRRERWSTASAGSFRPRGKSDLVAVYEALRSDRRPEGVAREPAARSTRRPQGGAEPDPGHARPSSPRSHRSARDADGCSRDREEPSRLGAPARARG